MWDVGEGVVAIYEPRQWQEVISYLVLGSERALLFDTGMGIAPISEVVSQLTDLPVTVLNSHTHMDHTGGNAEFSSIVAMDTEYTRSRSEGLPNERVREELAPEALCGPLPPGVTQDGYVARPWTITEVAADGHTIDLGERQLEVLHIPGHTPDAIALLDSEAATCGRVTPSTKGPSGSSRPKRICPLTRRRSLAWPRSRQILHESFPRITHRSPTLRDWWSSATPWRV